MARRSAVFAFVVACGGCSLVIDLKGLSTGDDPVDGGTAPVPSAVTPPDGAPVVADGSTTSSSSSTGGTVVDAAASRYRAAVLADKPVGYWRLGEKAKGAARDETGTRDGQYFGLPDYGVPGALAGDPDTAIHFSANGGFVDFGDSYDVFGGEFAVDLWMKAEPFSAGGAYSERFLVSKLANPPEGASGFHFWISAPYKDANGTEHGAALGADLCALTPAKGCTGLGATMPTALVHAALVRDQSALIIYVDGVEKARSASTHKPTNTPHVFQIGAEAGDGSFGGLLDEVALYDHALTPAQVSAHSAAGR